MPTHLEDRLMTLMRHLSAGGFEVFASAFTPNGSILLAIENASGQGAGARPFATPEWICIATQWWMDPVSQRVLEYVNAKELQADAEQLALVPGARRRIHVAFGCSGTRTEDPNVRAYTCVEGTAWLDVNNAIMHMRLTQRITEHF